MLTLQPGEVHVWTARYEAIVEPSTLARYDALMTGEERAQMARFYFENDRHRYRVTRALVRTTLSRYAPVSPHAWRFASNAYGRPEIAPIHGEACGLSFNISHTRGLIVLAVTREVALGIDVENTHHRAAPVDIAERYFSTREAAALAALEPARRPHRFYEYWTFKESYIKARGMGLSLALDTFTFSFPSEATVALTFDADMDDDPGRWEFWQWRAGNHFLVALCVERRTDRATHLVVQPALPDGVQDAGMALLRHSR